MTAPLTRAGDTAVTATFPAGRRAGTAAVVLTTPSGASAPVTFTYQPRGY
ncbi:hypothetical protein J2S43_004766 [Catenuloplanes nepalensis]|uniref:Uncharacterized protein n=1 Tax=Catenuloplanes nepalensis TaxID=587533 RepID=A0ABT9MXT3_9ACTN|nr:hypothetical protein [Catenuloplanes nepalensis]MDP9796254.1 hypothetical protein [Catenuloplanes nepalensis]